MLGLGRRKELRWDLLPFSVSAQVSSSEAVDKEVLLDCGLWADPVVWPTRLDSM